MHTIHVGCRLVGMETRVNLSPVQWIRALQFAFVNGVVDITPLVRLDPARRMIGELPTLVYSHRVRAHRVPIVLVHGMSPLGADDPRIDRCARALAANGYQVLVPSLVSLQQLRITTTTADELSSYVSAVVQDPRLCPDGQAAMMAASFSASLALNVAARPAMRGRMSALLSIGAFGSIDTLIPYLLTDSAADPYGAAVVMANFADAVLSDGEEIARLYHVKALHKFRPEDVIPREAFERALQSVSLRVRSAYWKIEHHAAYRQEIAHRILSSVPSICTALNVVEHVPHISAPLFLMHGATDNVVPPQELDVLVQALAGSSVRYQALCSPLLGHGQADLRPAVRDLWNLGRLLSGYFGAVGSRFDAKNAHLTLSEQG